MTSNMMGPAPFYVGASDRAIGSACSAAPSTGHITNDTIEVLTLGEMIVPGMVTGTAPIVAPGQIIFVLGDFRGDVWIRDI